MERAFGKCDTLESWDTFKEIQLQHIFLSWIILIRAAINGILTTVLCGANIVIPILHMRDQRVKAQKALQLALGLYWLNIAP